VVGPAGERLHPLHLLRLRFACWACCGARAGAAAARGCGHGGGGGSSSRSSRSDHPGWASGGGQERRGCAGRRRCGAGSTALAACGQGVFHAWAGPALSRRAAHWKGASQRGRSAEASLPVCMCVVGLLSSSGGSAHRGSSHCACLSGAACEPWKWAARQWVEKRTCCPWPVPLLLLLLWKSPPPSALRQGLTVRPLTGCQLPTGMAPPARSAADVGAGAAGASSVPGAGQGASAGSSDELAGPQAKEGAGATDRQGQEDEGMALVRQCSLPVLLTFLFKWLGVSLACGQARASSQHHVSASKLGFGAVHAHLF
jgi:hypothetical protein